MNYPSIARSLIGSTGFKVNISGRRKRLLLSACDTIFNDARTPGLVTLNIGDTSLRLDLSNPAERLLYYAPENLLAGYRRSDLYDIQSRLAANGGTFVDIGANLGIYSFLARELGFEALLFEPEPIHNAFLARNAHAFGTVIDCALSDTSGTTDFFVSGEENSGSSSLVMPEGGWSESEYKRVIPVRLATFDEIAAERRINLANIRLIKIDVEGNEEQTVLGMRNYLARPDVAPIWCEVRGPSSGRGRNSVSYVSSFLEEFGLLPFTYRKGALIPYRVGQDEAPQVFDLLFANIARHKQSLQLQTSRP